MWLRSGDSWYNSSNIKRIYCLEEKLPSVNPPTFSINFETNDGYIYPLAYFTEYDDASQWLNTIFNADEDLHFSPGPFIK